ncbi:MAG: hypothetical protein IJ544_07155 [Prevotella sp.]|nr:hypothetical protein [Prevotella sp.]
MPRKTDGMPFEIHTSPMKGKDGKNIVYVKPLSGRKISMKELDAYCAEHYALRPGELTRAFNAFIDATGYYLSEGYRLETLIGSFAPKIGLKREITDPDEVKTYDVQFEGIDYRSVKDYEESVLHWLKGFRRANNPNTQQLMADSDHLLKALQQVIGNYGYATARLFAYYANLTYYSARKQLDEWCKGEAPKLLKTKQGPTYIYTEI